jgi:hypothetical protein
MDNATGTLLERLIERDIQSNDLEALRAHIGQYEAEEAIQNDNPVWLTDDERKLALQLRQEMRDDGIL